MAELELTNVVNISVSENPAGVGEYNTSNVSIFTEEPYDAELFGDSGYKIYLSPSEVADDFGTESKTFAMANAIFSQAPNILAGNGYLVIIPFVVAVQHFALSGVPASGSFTLAFGAGTTAAINWNDPEATIQTKVRAIPGFEQVVVEGELSSQALDFTFSGVYGAVALPTVGGSGLQTSAPAAITITPTTTTAGESLAAAITRTKDLVQYFGITETVILDQSATLAAAAVIQPLNKMGAFPSYTSADVEPGGRLDLLRTGSFKKSRGLFYGGDVITGLTTAEKTLQALVMAASYAGRGFSTDFDGSNTTQTMHLKDLVGVQPDATMTQTLLNKCIAAGVDTYVSLQGVPKVFTSGENDFFDQVYNLGWFVGALQVAGFNYLAETATKIPQTESGMDGLKGAYRNVCEQGITNQYGAPGVWTSSTTFGNQKNFLQNILQRGYYIYSLPIGQQSQVARANREAPLVQIAFKEAGAIQKSNVIVNVNP